MTNDPCERGISLNYGNPAYDKWQVRWAPALATKIDDVSIGTLSGMLRASPLQVPPIAILTKTYHEPLTPWLKAFALPDGYKPFNPDFAVRMGKRWVAEGVADLPKDEAGLRALFGVGWWEARSRQGDAAPRRRRLQEAGQRLDAARRIALQAMGASLWLVRIAGREPRSRTCCEKAWLA
jgi:hypothetical protein